MVDFRDVNKAFNKHGRQNRDYKIVPSKRHIDVIEYQRDFYLRKNYFPKINFANFNLLPKSIFDYMTEYKMNSLIANNTISIENSFLVLPELVGFNYFYSITVLVRNTIDYSVKEYRESLMFVEGIYSFNFNGKLTYYLQNDIILRTKSIIFNMKNSLIRSLKRVCNVNNQISLQYLTLKVNEIYDSLPEINVVLHKDLSYYDNHFISSGGKLVLYDLASIVLEKKLFLVDIVALTFDQTNLLIYGSHIEHYIGLIKSRDTNLNFLLSNSDFQKQIMLSYVYLVFSYYSLLTIDVNNFLSFIYSLFHYDFDSDSDYFWTLLSSGPIKVVRN